MSDAAPAAPAAPATTAAPEAPAAAPSTPAAPAANGNWYDSFPDEVKGYVQNKGWKDPSATVESYRNLEKLVGVPPEQIIKLPKGDAPPEAWNEVWTKLGRPTDPKEYGFQVAEGGDGRFAEWAGKTFHELGMPKDMARNLVAKWEEFAQGQQNAADEERAAAADESARTLKTKWGAAHDQNVNVAKQAAQRLGVDGDTIDALEAAMGYAGVMDFFYSLGSKMGEGSFVTGGQQAGQFGILSPEAAKSKIQALQRDSEFVNRYTNGDVKAREEMARLHKWAYPEG